MSNIVIRIGKTVTDYRSEGWVPFDWLVGIAGSSAQTWSISDRITAEIVVDALEMARWRSRPELGTVVHADRGAQSTSWLFGHRLRQAWLLGSMGRVASSVRLAIVRTGDGGG